MIQIAKFQIEDVFEIKGKGLAFAGRVVDGVLSIGTKVEFNLNNNSLRREITAIEGIRHSNPKKINVGLLIKCQGENEIKDIIAAKETLSIIYVYSERLKLNEIVNWLSTKSIEHKVLFNEILLANLTVMNRAIWSDESTTDESKLESLRWSNELSHRIWKTLFDLGQNGNNESENKFGENLNYYGKQSKVLAGHLTTTTNLTINRFYYLIEKNNDTTTMYVKS